MSDHLIENFADGIATLKRPTPLRRGPLAGVVLGVLCLLLLQWCIVLANQPLGAV